MTMDTLITIIVVLVVLGLAGWSLWRTLTGRTKHGGWGCSCGDNPDGCCSQSGENCKKTH